MGLLRTTDRDGTTRPWTLKEIIQGKPIGDPSHPMFVHFPMALYPAVLALDVLSRLGRFPAAPLAATWLLFGAFAATAVLVLTGLVDRSTSKPGSVARRFINLHMTLQFSGAALFVLDMLIRWGGRHGMRAGLSWIALEAVGVGVVLLGAFFGGVLVYRIGFRVGESAPPAIFRKSAPEA